MDVVRITQALKQQNPARFSSRSGSSSNTLSSSTTEPMALHRYAWDGSSLTANTVHAQEQTSSTPISPTATSSPSPFFTLPSFSLSSILPAAVESAGGIFSGSGSAAGSRLVGTGSLGEMEVQSLLLRSMPMFGNLISKD
ncbi:hypothetical protein BG006_005004 [Podila minutissima]|uniref:Uncharacterized protein n=1 Tax=Podila minutissima TaxID=64525 RepID=A0A9P5VQH5_9FUNG|nr:hypothetical protein BG006_005004 [Podila minutissima]